MELGRLYAELVQAAGKIGLELREEPFETGLSEARVPRGGLCTVRGARVILVDTNAALPDRVAMLAVALSEVDLDAVYLPPIVRATVALHRRQAASLTEPSARPLARTNPVKRAPLMRLVRREELGHAAPEATQAPAANTTQREDGTAEPGRMQAPVNEPVRREERGAGDDE
jgi:hypothetical protein